jgi:hypothetical protein
MDAARKGLALVDKQNGIRLSRDWSNEEITKFLQKKFPRVLSSDVSEDDSPWLLCVRSNRKLKIFPKDAADGNDLFDAKGGRGKTFTEAAVFICECFTFTMIALLC